MKELYKVHRPKRFSRVHGQETAIAVLESKLRSKTVPQTILFTGPSGCGKSTLARILANKLECFGMDLKECNCADFRGIDMVREIRNNMRAMPLKKSKCRIWIIDEAHKLTNDAQNAFLKILEDTPRNVYFFLCTTEQNKILKAIVTRSMEIKTQLLSDADLSKTINEVAERADVKVDKAIVDKIISVAEGSARKALVLLDQISEVEGKSLRLQCIEKSDGKTLGFQLAQVLMDTRVPNTNQRWSKVLDTIKDMAEEPETVRCVILSYAASVMKKNTPMKDRAYLVINAFEGNYFAPGKVGEASLLRACYEVVLAK